MTRIVVISDSHRDLSHIARVREQAGAIDWLLHAGDHYQDAAAIAAQLGVDSDRVRAVIGNCDYPLTEPVETTVTIEGVPIWMVHGHHFGVKHTLDRLFYRARENGMRVAVFGHSHLPVCIEDGGVILFNPGSISLPRLPAKLPTFGLLEVDGGRVTATIQELSVHG